MKALNRPPGCIAARGDRPEGAGLDGEGADRATLHAPPDRRSPIITRYFSQDTLAGVLGRAAPPAQPKIAGSDRQLRVNLVRRHQSLLNTKMSA